MANLDLSQSASNTSLLTSVAATFGHAPQAGNLLVAAVTANVGTGSIAISGWTTGTSVAVGVAGGLVIFYKVSAGNETTVTATGTLAAFMDLHIFEYDGINNASPADKTATTADGGAGVTSRASGTTATLTQAKELSFVAVATAGNNGGLVSWSNSYNTEITTTDLMTADLITAATTATSSTATWTTSQRAAGAIITFFGETGDSYVLKIPVKPRKPRINWENSLTKGLIVDMPIFERGGTKTSDLCGNIPPSSGTLAGTASWKNYEKINFANATNDYVLLGTYLSTAISDRITIVVKKRKTDATLRNGVIFGTDNSGNNNRILSSYCPFGDGTVYWDFGGNGEGVNRLSVASLTFTDDIWVYTAGPVFGMAIWQNGIRRASNAATPTRSTTSVNSGINSSRGGTNGDLCDVDLFRVYNRELTPQEIKATNINPWQIYVTPGLLYNKSL